MWLRLDDGFATHPKVLAAGPWATVLQVRAICYGSQNRTDGFLPAAVVPMLSHGLDPSCTTAHMVQSGLWELAPSGFIVHDYLDWNMSKQQIEIMSEKLSKGGKKGMKRRWGKGRKGDNLPYNPGYNPAYNPTITTPITQHSTSTDTLNPLNSSESGLNPKSSSHAKKTKNRLCEFPPDFVLSDDMKSRAVALDLNPLQEFAKFKDHHLSKGSQFKDWSAAWRKWMRTGVEIKEARR